MSTSRCPLSSPRGGCWQKLTAAMERTRSSTGPACAVSRACRGRIGHGDPARATRSRQQPPGHRGDRQHRTATDRAARRHGCRAPSLRYRAIRVPGWTSWLRSLSAEGNDVGDRRRRCVGRSLAEPAVRPLRGRPSPAGRYLSCGLRGRAGDTARHDRRRRNRDVPTEDGRGVAVAQTVAQTTGAPVRPVLVDFGGARLPVAGPLRRDDDLPRHLRLCASRGWTAGHRHQLGAVEVVGRRPGRLRTPSDTRVGARAHARRCRHPSPVVGNRAPTPRPAPPSSPPTGTDWRRLIAPEHRFTYSTTCCRPNPTPTPRRRRARSSAKRCATANRRAVAICWSTTSAHR